MEDRLIDNVEELCLLIERGKAAAKNKSVQMQNWIGIAGIVLSALSGAGILAAKLGEGWRLTMALLALFFGIVTQIANQFRVAQRAADSEAVAL